MGPAAVLKAHQGVQAQLPLRTQGLSQLSSIVCGATPAAAAAPRPSSSSRGRGAVPSSTPASTGARPVQH